MLSLKKIIFSKLNIIAWTLLLIGSIFMPKNLAEARSVRVGYIDYPNFIDNVDFQFQGYGFEYLSEIEDNSDLRFEYIHDTWSNCLAKLLSGEIDLVCTAQRSLEREALYSFSKKPIGIESTIIYTRGDEDDIAYEEFSAFQGRKIGMLKDSFQNELYPAYAREHNFTCKISLYTNETDMMNALTRKQIDLALCGSLARHPSFKQVGEFGAEPFYFMTSKNDEELLTALNSAVDKIMAKNVYFNMELHDKWYGKKQNSYYPNFTREELNYIKNAPVFSVGVRVARPFAFKKKDNSGYEGIIPGLMNLVSKKSGLKFKFASISQDHWPLERVLNGDFALGVGFINPRYINKKLPLLISKPIFASDFVSLVRMGENPGLDRNLRVGYAQSSVFLDQVVKGKYPLATVLTFPTSAAGAKAVADKNIDAFVVNSYSANRILQNPRYHSLTLVPNFTTIENLYLVGRNDKVNPLVISIINKTLNILSTKEINSVIINETVVNSYRATMQDFIYQQRHMLFFIVLLLVLSFIIFFRSNMIKSKALKQISASNQHLKQVAAMATSSNEAKSTFLSSMSHDIRTPLNAIIGLTVLAKEEKENQGRGIQEYLDKVLIASKTLLGIVNNVLDMSAIENKKMPVNLQIFNLPHILEELVEVYRGECKRRHIDLQIDFSGIIEPVVEGDDGKIVRVIDNLISNAYKFTPGGGRIKFIVTQKIYDEQALILEFVVEDNGCGMSEDMQKRLFLPFEQERDGRLNANSGAGLGMSITKYLVDIMDGNISFTSELDVGTTFKVNLLLNRVASSESTKKDYFSDSGKSYDFAGARILVAEDNAINSEIVKKLLVKANLVVDIVPNGKQAVDCFAKHQGTSYYSAILMDIQMPVLNGLIATKRIRKLEKKDEHIPIIAMTANVFAEDIAATSGAGMDGHIAKPLNREAMYATLAKLIKK